MQMGHAKTAWLEILIWSISFCYALIIASAIYIFQSQLSLILSGILTADLLKW